MDYSIILPCLNEEKTIGICIEKIKKALDKDYEIIVADSSSDNSAKIAEEMGAKVVKVKERGYGNAYLAGINIAGGNFIIMGDADDTYDFMELPKLLEHINKFDFVIGDRMKLGKGSMPMLHRYIGNPLLSMLLRIMFNSNVKDCHCGLRVVKKDLLDKMDLKASGMDFASEMIIKASDLKVLVKNVPISYYARKGESKLSSFRDGWKHLKLMVRYKFGQTNG